MSDTTNDQERFVAGCGVLLVVMVVSFFLGVAAHAYLP